MLLVDADPQGQVALGLGFPKKVRVTLKNMLENIIMGLEFDPKEVILKHKEGVEVIPANKLLAGLDVALINVEDREKVLKEYLELLEDDYDYILIDCMPSLGMMVINALYAADSVLIPVQPQYYATDGLTELLKAVKGIKQRYNPKLEMYRCFSQHYVLHSLTHNEGFENFFWTFEFFGLGSYRIDIWMDPNQRMQAVYLDWKNGEFHRFHQELFRHSRNRCQE